MGVPIELVCCYAREDEADLKKLIKHLKVLERTNVIHIWHDRQIYPGEDYANAIDTHLDSAQIILLLTSANFINSDYCYGNEMQRALDRQKRGEARVVPVILHDCLWQVTPLGMLQALPADGLPISRWSNEHSAHHSVTEGVRRLADELQVLVLRETGDGCYKAGRFAEALEVYNDALAVTKQYQELVVSASVLARIYQGMGDSFFQINRDPDALECYEQALRYDDTLLWSYERKGQVLYYLNRNTQALVILDEAIKRGSAKSDVFYTKYNALIELDRREEALDYYEQMYLQLPNSSGVHGVAAKLFEQFQYHEQALEAWRRYISLVDDSEGYQGKARALENLGRYEEALEAYEHVLTLKPNDPRIYLRKGLLLDLLKRDQEALVAFDAALQC